MDTNIKWVNKQRILKTIKSLEANNINGYLASSKEDLIEKIEKLVESNSVVGYGGSMTLAQSGVMNHLRSGRYKLLDRDKVGLNQDEVKEIYRSAFSADAYFTSTNAITEQGELYNVDGNGNRVAAMLYGPEKVIVIVGVNKIVKDIKAAIERNKQVSAPANAKRLNKQTPCATEGYCMNCKSKDKICREYTLIRSQNRNDRMHVIFINDELGY